MTDLQRLLPGVIQPTFNACRYVVGRWREKLSANV
jgi:hypothetical protein